MTQIVHIQTTIQTVFGLLDNDGNVFAQSPVQATISRFSVEAFSEAHAAITAERDKASASANLPDEEQATVNLQEDDSGEKIDS